MMANLAPKQSRALAVAILALVIIAAYLVLVQPYRQAYVEYQTRLARADEQLFKYRSLIDQQDRLREQLEQLKNLPQFSEYYFQEDTPALAYAALQNLVKRAVSKSGGKLVSTQTITSKTSHEGLVPVTVKVSMKGTIETLYTLVHALEGRSPLLFLDKVSIQSTSAATRRRYKTAVAPQLDIRFDLTGYIRSEEEQSA